MIYSKQRGKRTYVPITPDIHAFKRKRVLFSVLNVIIVIVIVMVLAFTILAIL
jgi:hypothetical protein